MIFRLYWLGPATEPGNWGIDTGIGTPIWRIHSWELTGLVRPDAIAENAPASHPGPRGWIRVYEENGFVVYAPQATFARAGLYLEKADPIVRAYQRYAEPTA